ncbi:hypothetical protein BC624_10880 [Flavobacterium granuli]|uniref:Uncharacterized protein n=2 Tax=Flavobacterium granuli TaxID=280093 RepID=A0A1M5R798_9FLAO|nr:hypothetical protein [Flavobacterium granuli]PRZ21640.1 hypothetical protein BC624_10880 [Flavobacterium granuli]SHH22245.1 hypothetical protein SAMN05443373_10979 [Flavobacterium granuli]
MFLNYIKGFFLKRKLKNIFYDVKSTRLVSAIKTVGLLVDESYFLKREALVKELVSNGIIEENIKIIIYKDKLSKSQKDSGVFFSSKELTWNAEITSVAVNDFIKEEFDLLISYYEVQKPILKLITHRSNAKFKAGFATIDKRLNHLIISAHTEDYRVFTSELFRYLKKIKQNR